MKILCHVDYTLKFSLELTQQVWSYEYFYTAFLLEKSGVDCL